MIKEIREKFQEKVDVSDVKVEDKEREPGLEGIASDHDLKLFREAQAVASEKNVCFNLNFVTLLFSDSFIQPLLY